MSYFTFHCIVIGAVIAIALIVTLCKDIAIQNKIKRDKENEIETIKLEFGPYSSFIRFKPVDSHHHGIILANIDNNRIKIEDVDYKISEIENCDYSYSKSSTETTYTEKQVIQTDNMNAIKRAAIGGVLGGGVGAVVGGMTAQKEIKTVKIPHTYYRSSSYTMYLTKNGLRIGIVSTHSENEIRRICDYVNKVRRQYQEKYLKKSYQKRPEIAQYNYPKEKFKKIGVHESLRLISQIMIKLELDGGELSKPNILKNMNVNFGVTMEDSDIEIAFNVLESLAIISPIDKDNKRKLLVTNLEELKKIIEK